MLRIVRCIIGVGLLCAATAQASTTVINFNSDPTALGITFPPAPNSAAWVPDSGLAYDSVTNASDGYMKLTDAVGGQQGVVVFPDFDNGAVVQGFTFDCWVRVGNGSSAPADGFSINYARPGPVAFNAGNAAEECTTTGIGVGFDAYDNGAGDPIALDIWVDGTNIFQYPMTYQNGLVTDPSSIQTQVGPYDGTGSRDVLGWAHLVVDLKTNGLLNVNYKNTWILTNFATDYRPGPGQLVMAGRTGGSWEVQDVDQITITTTLAQLPVFVAATGLPDGVQVTFIDSGSGVVDLTKPVTMSIDGGAVTPTAMFKNGTLTTLTYIGYPVLLTAGSSHTVLASVTDTAGVVVSSGTKNFTVGAYNGVVSPSLAVKGVDTNTVGFRIKPWQSGIEPNDIWWANEQLVGLHGAINPLCDLTSFTHNGYLYYNGVINFDYTNAAGTMNEDGNFTLNNGYENIQLPGIVTDPNPDTTTTTNVDNCALEVLCFLHFQRPGAYTLGVISDDGFAVTVGPNPADWGALMLGSFEGGRGADAGTSFGFVVPTAGYYPFRLMWENGNGGANVEWFAVQPDGTKILINDPSPTNTTGITAYYGGPALPAFVSDQIPYPGVSYPRPDKFSAMLTDLGTTVTTNTITLAVNGVAVTPVIQQAGGVTTVSAPSGYLLPRGSDTAQLVYSTSGGGPFTNTWSFTVGASLSPLWAVTGVDTNQPGFRILPWQSGAQNNSTRYTLEQLAGIHGRNHADLSSATDGGYIDYTNVINFNINPPGGDAGDFTTTANGFPDSAFPGLPGDLGDVGNESIRVLAFLKFDHAGAYSMGVNSDDGFVVTTGLSPSDWFAPIVGEFSGGRGALDTIFSFYVVSPGIYPFQLLWENGNGSFAGGNGAECEWFLVDTNGVKILLNNPSPTNDTGVVAFFKGPTLPAYVSEFSPAAGATGVLPNAFDFELTDGSTTVTTNTIAVSINGVAVTPVISQASGVTKVGLPLLPGGTNTAQVVYNTSGTGGPFTNAWSFTVVTNTQPILNAAWSVTSANTPGFRLLPWNSGIANPNTIRWTLEQLAGMHGDNNADLTTATDNGYIDYSGVINFDTGVNHDGSFVPPDYTDINFPGIPGPNGVTDNSSMEVLTYLHFDHIGAYTMGVNSDDNFAVMAGANPSDWFAPILGASDVPGGKGASDVLFTFVVTNTAGFYPFRLVWENGAGGCNLEWFAVQPDGTKVLINDPAPPENTGITAYQAGTALPAYVAAFEPADGATGVAQGIFGIELKNGSTTVNTNCITLLINGAPVTPEIEQQGGSTWISLEQPLPAGSSNYVTFSYCTSGGTFTHSWSFVVGTATTTYVTLPANLWTPPGSGSNPGFAIKIFQTPNTNIFNNWYVLPRESDMALDGLYGANVADLTEYTNNGEMWWPSVINFAQNADSSLASGGEFQAPEFPDAAVPGLGAWDPTTVGTAGKMDNFAVGMRTFLEFPEAGIWYLGVNSDDCFRASVGDQGAPGKSPLTILAPASEAGEMTAMTTTQDDDGNSGASGFGRNPPSTTPLIGQAVLCNPVDCSAPLVNASAIAGHIAVCYRGPSFATQARRAQDAGAVAVIGGTYPTDAPYPGPRGGTDAGVTIPCLQVGYPDFNKLTNHITMDTSSPVVVRITAQDCSAVVGQYSYGGGRGQTTETIFGVVVPAAGLYPLRLLWDNGGGGNGCEWFVIDPDTGLDYLINEPDSPVKAWITRNVHAAGALPAPKLNNPTVSGGNVIISWTGQGELWESYSINGPWFKSTYQANPSTVVPSPFLPERFFRVRQY